MMVSGEGTERPCASEDLGQKEETVDGTAVDEGVFDSPDPEKAQPTREHHSPEMPTKSQMQEHKITHCFDRSWCDECVEAFGRERPHTSTGNERRILVHVDYLFLTSRGLKSRDALEPDENLLSQTVAVAYWRHQVPLCPRSGAERAVGR